MSKDKDEASLQTIVQINVFRRRNEADGVGGYQFLLLKRDSEHDGGQFWQPISEALREGETIAEGLQRVAREQAGIDRLDHMSHSVYSYDWYSNGESGRDIVFAAQVPYGIAILPDLLRFSTFEWLPFGEALSKLKWSGSKEALRQLRDHLERRENEQEEADDGSEAGNNPQDAGDSNQVDVTFDHDGHDDHDNQGKHDGRGHKRDQDRSPRHDEYRDQDHDQDHHHDPDEDARPAQSKKPEERETNLLDGLPRAYDPDQDTDGTLNFPL